MEEIINKILKVFKEFSDIELIINYKTNEIKDFDFEEIDFLFYDKINEIETDLQHLYLSGNDLTLNRVKSELSKIKNLLLKIDFGLIVTINNDNDSKKIIDPEIIKELQKIKLKYINQLVVFIDQLPTHQTETEKEHETIEIKPVLKSDTVLIVFEIIKDFFSTEQQPELKEILETGNNTNKKLLFKDNGNRLTDTFKKLIEHDFIIGCQKRDLINWIIINFNFTHQNKVKGFIYDTVEKTISRKDNPCKSPLIIIENRQIQKVEVPRNKKYKKW